jgi:hypothetical protein
MKGSQVVPNRMCCTVVGMNGAVNMAGCASSPTLPIANELCSSKSPPLLADLAHATI